MKIAISGSHGFIASRLVESFTNENHHIIAIERELLSSNKWQLLAKHIEKCDVVINLAGATINQRWSQQGKAAILDSRIESTSALVKAINSLDTKPKLFISASAVGIYNFDVISNEQSTDFGGHFLSTVCQKWEAEARKVSPEVRLIIPRFGVVLSNDGGALHQILLPFKYYIGGRIGDGKQGFSWIHIDDLTEAFKLFLTDERASGPINLTAPQNTDNQMLTNTISGLMIRPTWMPVPAFVLNLILGERAEIITKGAKIYPNVLYYLGFNFKYPTIDKALLDLLKKH
ncbi:MAG: TIGR01777 family oxidoreductase [Bacteroidales bacterium]